jgi:mediator of RNA polymerase II transcription subunit 12
LDHDHFLEWFLSSFEAASIGTIPVWLLMLGIYWNSIMRYRRRGRRLAELLLQKLRQVRSIYDGLPHARDHTDNEAGNGS